MDRKELHRLVPYFRNYLSIVQLDRTEVVKRREAKRILPVNHGTLCTALLIEALQNKAILNKVQITNVTVVDGFGENSLTDMMNSINYYIKSVVIK